MDLSCGIVLPCSVATNVIAEIFNFNFNFSAWLLVVALCLCRGQPVIWAEVVFRQLKPVNLPPSAQAACGLRNALQVTVSS